jgi:hypothetical protein
MILRSILLTTSICALAACGGSGGGDGSGSTFDGVLSDFTSSATLQAGVSETIEYGDFSELEAAGGATYTGETIVYTTIGTLDLDDVEDVDDLPAPDLVGSVSLETSFSGGEGTISGTFDDFIDSDGNSKTGEITIAEGAIFEDDFDGSAGFIGLIDGTLGGSGEGNGRYQGVTAGTFLEGDSLIGAAFGVPISNTTDLDDLEEDELDDFDDLEDGFAMVFVAD